jgi:hypothetical protein
MNMVRKVAGLSALAALAASSTVALSGVSYADGESTNGTNGHAGTATSRCQSTNASQPDMYGSPVPSQCVVTGGVGGSGGSY